MTATVENLLHEALTLPVGERLRLANHLLVTTYDGEIQSAWAIEVERRISVIDTGEMKEIPIEKAIADLKRNHAK